MLNSFDNKVGKTPDKILHIAFTGCSKFAYGMYYLLTFNFFSVLYFGNGSR
jgi:hypothetical protein